MARYTTPATPATPAPTASLIGPGCIASHRISLTPHRPPPPFPYWGALGKLVHFGPKNNMFSKAAFPFVLHVVHTFPQMQRSCLTYPYPSPPPPLLSSTLVVKATPTPTSATPFAHICTCACCLDIGYCTAICPHTLPSSPHPPCQHPTHNTLCLVPTHWQFRFGAP